jgi:hypothetical protein
MRALILSGVVLAVLLSTTSAAPSAVKVRVARDATDPLGDVGDLVSGLLNTVLGLVQGLLGGGLLGGSGGSTPLGGLTVPVDSILGKNILNLVLKLINLDLHVKNQLAEILAVASITIYVEPNPEGLVTITIDVVLELKVSVCTKLGTPLNLCPAADLKTLIVNCSLIRVVLNSKNQLLGVTINCGPPLGHIVQGQNDGASQPPAPTATGSAPSVSTTTGGNSPPLTDTTTGGSSSAPPTTTT